MHVATAKSKLLRCEEYCQEKCERTGLKGDSYLTCVDECLNDCAEYQEAARIHRVGMRRC